MNKGDFAHPRADLVIGGAGFAGLALAIALRQGLGETGAGNKGRPGFALFVNRAHLGNSPCPKA